jgi:hypothetical protein
LNYTNTSLLQPNTNFTLLHYQDEKCAEEIIPKNKVLVKNPLQDPMEPLLNPIDPLCLKSLLYP